MKKIIQIMASGLLMISSIDSSAQNWVNGGNNLSATGKLGTTSNQSLSFITANIERARITNAGNFGIGTATPLTKLHVNGFGSFGSNVTTLNATRALNLVDKSAVMRILRVDATNAPAVELISRTSADGANVSYWDLATQPADASFRIRDRTTGTVLDRITITHAGNVGLGTTTPSAKLEVVGSTTVGNGLNVSGYENGLYAGSNSTYGNGVYGSSDQGIGTEGYSASGAGVFGLSSAGGGVSGLSTDGIGGSFESTNYHGLVARTTNGFYAGVFYGNVYSSDEFITSDKNLKKDFQEFGDATSIINKLKPQNYLFKDDAKYASLHLPKGRHYGLLAQDLEQVLPNLVSEAPHELKTVKPMIALKPTAEGKPAPPVMQQKETTETIKIKAVNYIELIPIIVKAMQEQEAKMQQQQALIEKQNSKIEALTQFVSQLSQNSHSEATVKFSSLGLAIPNPANNSTRISYKIPANSANAVMIINNEAGQIVKQMQLDKSGMIDLDTSKLSSGTYFYTLLINGASVDTKKMIVNR